MKTIVTHISPDVDACTSVWLVKRLMPGWEDAELAFVNAGKTLNEMEPDSNPEIIHVDTGFGKFDHHQTADFTCASKLAFEHLLNENLLEFKLREPLERMITVVNEFDHFRDAFYPDSAADHYEFSLHIFLDLFKNNLRDDHKVMDAAFICLDAIFYGFKSKVKAEQDIKNGFIFQSKWGKSLAMESIYEGTMKLAQKMGYSLVIRKDPEKGYLKVKTLPKKELDLEPLYLEVKKADPDAFWFLHASHNMLLNGSSKNPNMVPTKLTIQKVIEIIRNIG